MLAPVRSRRTEAQVDQRLVRPTRDDGVPLSLPESVPRGAASLHAPVIPDGPSVGDLDRSGANAFGTHSMRRTKAALIYRKTGNLRAVQLLLGHSKLESTVRYLGIDVDDALEISEQTEV